MKKLICKIHSEWGQKVTVGTEILTINAQDGSIEVPEAHAARMLQNANKWHDAALAPPKRQPAQRAAAPVPVEPLPEIRDATGRLLSGGDDAALSALQGKPAVGTTPTDPLLAQAELAKSTPPPQPLAAVEEHVEAETPPSDDWPQVSMKHSKDYMIGVLKRLAQKGVKGVDLSEKATKTKADCLEQIEKAYEKLS